jgi:predicted transcriptional regulator
MTFRTTPNELGETRTRLIEVIVKNPGATVMEACRASGVTHSTGRYHFRILERFRMVRIESDGRFTRVFLASNKVPSDVRAAAVVLRHPNARRLLWLAGKRPNLNRTAIARELGVSLPTIEWHVRRLMRANLIQRIQITRGSTIHVDRAAVARVDPTFFTADA